MSSYGKAGCRCGFWATISTDEDAFAALANRHQRSRVGQATETIAKFRNQQTLREWEQIRAAATESMTIRRSVRPFFRRRERS